MRYQENNMAGKTVWGQNGTLEGTFVTADLKKLGGASATEIDLSSAPTVAGINVELFADAYVSYAATSAAVLTNLGADTTRQKLSAGVYSFSVEGNEGFLAFMETGGSADVTDGLSYHLVEG
jgi:hypothetical protein